MGYLFSKITVFGEIKFDKFASFISYTGFNLSGKQSYGPHHKKTWVKVFRIIPEFRILRLTFYGKSASKY